MKYKILKFTSFAFLAAFLPIQVFAAFHCTLAGNPKLGDLLNYVTCLISKSVIPLIFALALAAFVWGVVQFVILGSEDEAKRAKGKQFMIWGILALAVMFSVWGLIKVLTTTFNLSNTGMPTLPGVVQ